MEDYQKLFEMYSRMESVPLTERLKDIQLRTPLEVEDIYRDRIIKIIRSLKYEVKDE